MGRDSFFLRVSLAKELLGGGVPDGSVMEHVTPDLGVVGSSPIMGMEIT